MSSLGHALDGDGVELDGIEAEPQAALDPAHDAVEVVAARDLDEAPAIEGVEMDVDAAQTGVVRGLGLIGQQHAVGREREVVDAGNCVQSANQLGQILRTSGSPPVTRNLRTPSERPRARSARSPRS